MTKEEIGALKFIYNRLLKKYGESERIDYMVSLETIINVEKDKLDNHKFRYFIVNYKSATKSTSIHFYQESFPSIKDIRDHSKRNGYLNEVIIERIQELSKEDYESYIK